jgi:hypothetical protein
LHPDHGISDAEPNAEPYAEPDTVTDAGPHA